jgi:hypothetical protein
MDNVADIIQLNTITLLTSNTTCVSFIIALKYFTTAICFNVNKAPSSGWYSNEAENGST